MMNKAIKRKAGILAAMLACSTLLSPLASAQENAAAQQMVNRPDRGTSMDNVRQQHGEPRQASGAIGEPPITRWIYDAFTVYFEHDKVIHSVVEGQEPTAR